MAQTLIFQVFSVAGHLVRYIRKQATKKKWLSFYKKTKQLFLLEDIKCVGLFTGK